LSAEAEAFPCVSCGICCKNLHPELYADLRLPDGTCRHYDDELRRCAIYENRPLKCRIDAYYEGHLQEVLSREEYVEENLQACLSLMKLAGDNERYRTMFAHAQRIRESDTRSQHDTNVTGYKDSTRQ
jgi:uncharacterized protein